MKYPHWNYLLSLDSDLYEISRFVEINKDNYKTYSLEFTRLFLAACSEIDVVAKLFCERIQPGGLKKIQGKRGFPNMNDYCKIITGNNRNLHKMEINLPRYEINLFPWSEFESQKPPSWWGSYNKVKHNRDVYYSEANLENTIKSIAGLYVIVLYYYYCWKNEFNYGIKYPTKVLADGYLVGQKWANSLYYSLP